MIKRVRCHNFGGSVRFITNYSGKSNKLSNLSNVAQSLKYMSIDTCRGDKFLLGQICAVAWQICVNCDWCNQYCSQSRTVRGTKNRRIHSCKCPALPTMHPQEPSKAFWMKNFTNVPSFHQAYMYVYAGKLFFIQKIYPSIWNEFPIACQWHWQWCPQEARLCQYLPRNFK